MEKPTQLPFLCPAKYKLPTSIARQYVHTKMRVIKLESSLIGFDVRSARNAGNGPDRSKRPCTDAAADGCTAIIPSSKTFPVFRKIIRRRKKKRQILTFLSSIYQDEDPGQKFFYLPGTSLIGEAIGVRSR